MAGVTQRPLLVRSGSVELAGTLWEPDRPASATLLMHPGSGPSTRDNDTYFPEIREHLLAARIAVASFDKRGVGASTGHWTQAGIVEQAQDATAALEHLGALGVTRPLGLFGHSQGGWVVVEAAGCGAAVDFVVTNSGPGVSPAVQERYSLQQALRRAGADDADARLTAFDAVVEMLRSAVGFDAARARLEAIDAEGTAAYGACDEAEWGLVTAIIDHDPRPAMRGIDVPVLALFGADDEVVPVEASVEVFRAEVRPDLLTVAVLPGGNHRVQAGDPPRLVEGYAHALVGFILERS